MNLTQKISNKLNYDVDQFSKKSEQNLRDPLEILLEDTRSINDHENKIIALEYEITRLKQDKRELIQMKIKLENSLIK